MAIKILDRISGADDEEELTRFKNEGVAACRIEHPNAVKVLDFGVTPGGAAYLVMELLHGEPLRDELERTDKGLPIKRALEIVTPIGFVLAQAHSRGIVHRDIKPANVFLHRVHGYEVVKLLDFGLAKVRSAVVVSPEEELRRSGIVGTPAYLAPERARSKPYDGRSDVYAVGCMLFEMLSGATPYGHLGPDPIAVAVAHIREPTPDVRDINPDIPDDLAQLVQVLMSKDPNQRPAAADLVLRLGTMMQALHAQ